MSSQAATTVDEFEIALPSITTMVSRKGTGFYAIQWGPLPYRFAGGASERFRVRRLDHLLIFETDPEQIDRRAQALYRSSAALATLLTMDSREWPPPPLPEGAAGAAALAMWSRCAIEFPRLADAVSERCLWCADDDHCLECVGAEADAIGIESVCTDLMWAATRDHAARCRWELDGSTADSGPTRDADRAPADPICDDAVRLWRDLVGGVGVGG
jgi:hypothetical protein